MKAVFLRSFRALTLVAFGVLASTEAIGQIEVKAVTTGDAGAWWARWLALVLIGGVVTAICFLNPRRGQNQ